MCYNDLDNVSIVQLWDRGTKSITSSTKNTNVVIKDDITLEAGHYYLLLGYYVNTTSATQTLTTSAFYFGGSSADFISIIEINPKYMSSMGGNSLSIGIFYAKTDISVAYRLYNYLGEDYTVNWRICKIQLK